VGGIKETKDGLFIPKEKSWLISYDENQFKWAKTDLIEGELSEDRLNEQNGIIVVAIPLRKGISTQSTSLQLGDKVNIQTPSGRKEMKVMGILNTVPFSDSNTSLTTFITTEKLFTDLTGESTLKVIDFQLEKSNQDQTVGEIKNLLDPSVTLNDQRQKNKENNQTFLTIAVFVYGFVIVIALISILNIINTMNTSVAAKTCYLGVMRAIGMSGKQLDKMILMEAFTYSLTGYILGSVSGIALQKALIEKFLSLSAFHIAWKFPSLQVILILVVILLVTRISVINPLKSIKAQGISGIIGSL
jgi:putative ABC transport system permease protein